MIDRRQVIEESLPMISEFISDIRITSGNVDNFSRETMVIFSNWIAEQVIKEEQKWYIVSRIAAYIGNYFISNKYGSWVIQNDSILIQSVIDEENKVYREFDPYILGLAIADKKTSIESVLSGLTSH